MFFKSEGHPPIPTTRKKTASCAEFTEKQPSVPQMARVMPLLDEPFSASTHLGLDVLNCHNSKDPTHAFNLRTPLFIRWMLVECKQQQPGNTTIIMKSMNLTKIAVTLAALTVGTYSYGQGTVANLTLKLTEYFTDSALLLKDESGKVVPGKIPTYENEYSIESGNKSIYTYEYGSKIATYKISNKEFLEALVEDGLISDIKGWSVVMVENDGENTAFITKKGETPINVSQYLYSEWGEAEAVQENYKYVTTETANSYSESESGAFKAKFLIGVKSQFSFLNLNLQGVYDESATLKIFGKGEDQYTQWMPGARSVTSISGTLVYEDGEDGGDSSVVTGSISIAAGKQVDIGL